MSDHVPGDPVVGERIEGSVDGEFTGIYLGLRGGIPGDTKSNLLVLCVGHPTHPNREGRVWWYSLERSIRWGEHG